MSEHNATLQALAMITSVLGVLHQKTNEITQLLLKLENEGRTKFTPEELAVIRAGTDAISQSVQTKLKELVKDAETS